MKESVESVSSEGNIRADLLALLSKTGKADMSCSSVVVDEILRTLEMIRHFRDGGGVEEGNPAVVSVRDALHLVLRDMNYL